MDNDSASEQELCETTDSEDNATDVSDDKSHNEGVSESLSDIDDAEVGSYLNNEKEKEYKKIIWEMMNQKYLQEQEAKRVAATSNVTNSKKDLRHQKATRENRTQSTTKPAHSTSPKKLPSVNPKRRRIDLDSDNEVEGSSIGRQVKGATNVIEDDENGWEDDSNYSSYNNHEEDFDYYDDGGLF